MINPHMINHAKDIPAVDFLRAVQAGCDFRRKLYNFDRPVSCTRWDIGKALIGKPLDNVNDVEGLNQKIVLAKAKKLIKRGLIQGCACGCRGDFELTAIGELKLNASQSNS